ncbi:hypothetical protein [Microbacterium sp.]|uniref:hypothetical protein n=1 Tax=Microbacterium sp. TaxID=51671 RepID=UPI00391C4870
MDDVEWDSDKIDAVLKLGRSTEQVLRNVDETLDTAADGLSLLEVDRYYYDGPIEFVGVPPEHLPTVPHTVSPEMVRAMAHPLTVQHRRGIRIAITFAVATSHALQNLRSREPGFDEWWAPRSATLRADPLARFFYQMRSTLLKEGWLKATNVLSSYNVADERNWVEVHTSFHNAPETHQGEDIRGLDSLELLSLYLGDLGTIVSDAWAHFLPGVDSQLRAQPLVEGGAIYDYGAND